MDFMKSEGEVQEKKKITPERKKQLDASLEKHRAIFERNNKRRLMGRR